MASKSRPIEIEVIAQIAKTLSANKELEISFGDVAEAVLDVSKDSDRSAKDIAEDLVRIQKAAGKTEREIDDLGRGAKKSFKGVGDAAGRAGKDTNRALGDLDTGTIGKELGSEFAQNLGESIASGDSSTIVTDSAGGLFSSLAQAAGPVGQAISIGGFLAVSLWQAFREKTDEVKEEVAQELGDALFEAFDEVTGRLSEVEVGKAALTALGVGDYQEGLSRIREIAVALGISEEEALNILTAQDDLNASLRTQLELELETLGVQIREAERRKENEKKLGEFTAFQQKQLDRNKERYDAIADALSDIDSTSEAVAEATGEALANRKTEADILAGREKQDKKAEESAEKQARKAERAAKARKEEADAAERTRDAINNTKDKTVTVTLNTVVLGQGRQFYQTEPGKNPFG